MVADLKDYPWTSYAAHGLGRAQVLIAELPVWARLGVTELELPECWRRWVHEPLTGRELAALRHALASGRPF